MRLVRCTASALRIRSRPSLATETDTGRRLLMGQSALSYGESFDGKWLWLAAEAGEGWSSKQYLEDAPPTLLNPYPKIPHGLAQIISVFGEAGGPACSNGMVNFPEPIGSARRFACHQKMVGPFEVAFKEVYRRGLWDHLHTFDGCYNVRPKSGTRTGALSTHSWGIAVDVNAGTNGFGRPPQLNRAIVAIFEDVGFLWGGRWSTPDGMHFQWATGY